MQHAKREVIKRGLLKKAVVFSSFIGKDTSITGSFSGEGNILVEGTVRGDTDIKGVVVILSTGKWIGRLSADVIVVAGVMEGDIDARKSLTIAAGGRVKGNLSCQQLELQQSGIHEGEIRMRSQSEVAEITEKRKDSLLQGLVMPG